MRRLLLLGLLLSVGAAGGCTDTPPTSQPPYTGAAGSGGGGAPGGGSRGNGAAGTGGSGGAVVAGNGGNDAGADGPGAGGAGGVAGTAGITGVAGAAGTTGVAGAAGTTGVAGTAGTTGVAGAGGTPQLAAPAATGLVALNTDFSTSSLSILSTAGGLVQADCVDSATGSNGGAPKTISGNVMLPSQPQRGGDVVVVDRGNGVLTFVDPARCRIRRQIPVPGGAKTDPLDVVMVSDDKAYVTRYLKNFAATDPTLAGNDVVVIDPATGAAIGQIGLDAYASVVSGAAVLVRPTRALIANGKVVVSLDEIDAVYMSYGEGKVVVIDPATDRVVASVALTGLYDCQGMDYIASTKTLLVACGGPSRAQNQPVESGIAVVDLGASPPRLVRSISSVAFDDRPVSSAWVVALSPAGGGTRAFAVTNDPTAIGPDALFAFDYVLGTTSKVASSEARAIGQPAGVPGLLLVPFSTFSTPQIKLFDVAGAPQADSGFASDPVTGLPPLAVAAY